MNTTVSIKLNKINRTLTPSDRSDIIEMAMLIKNKIGGSIEIDFNTNTNKK